MVERVIPGGDDEDDTERIAVNPGKNGKIDQVVRTAALTASICAGRPDVGNISASRRTDLCSHDSSSLYGNDLFSSTIPLATATP